MTLQAITLDLDDTLINTRHRTRRILGEFLAQPDLSPRYPEEVERLRNLDVSEIRYQLADTLAGRHVANAAFLAEAAAFWFSSTPRIISAARAERLWELFTWPPPL